MPTLTIGDKSVSVDDSFLKLPPDQQNAAVEEIAASLGVSAPKAEASSPITADNVVRSMANDVLLLGGVLNKANAATNAALAPVLNPLFAPGDQLQGDFGERYAKSLEMQNAGDAKFAKEHPVAKTVAGMVGGTAAMLPAMAAAPVAFGLAGPMSTMVRNGAISNALLSGADAAIRGQNPLEAGAIGGVIGGAAGPGAHLIGKGVSAIADRVNPGPVVQQNVARVGNVEIPLSVAEATQDPIKSAEQQIMLRGGRGDAVQTLAKDFEEARSARLNAARDEISASLDPTGTVARTAPQDAAEKIAAELIAKEEARKAAQAGAVSGPMAPSQMGQDLARSFGGGEVRAATPFDAAESLSGALDRSRTAARGATTAKYKAAEMEPGGYAPGSSQAMIDQIKAGLANVRLGPQTTPIANEALPMVEQLLTKIGTKAAPPATAANPEAASTVEAIRKQYGDQVAAAYERQTAAKPAAGSGLMEPHSVDVAGGGKVDVVPKVVEASSLKASSDAGYDAALQPRDRSRAASVGQVNDIAKNLNPERLGRSAEADRGAPIVGPDGMVESGNGRIAALRQAYKENGPQAQAYRAWLEGQGVNVAGMREPVLVRERATQMSPQERLAFTVGANSGATLTMSAPERALADAKLISPDSLASIKNPADLASSENRDFARQFASRLPQTEQGAFVDAQGRLSAEGATRVRNAVLAKAYGDSPILSRIAESTSDEIKSISNALTTAAPEWAAIRAGVEAGSIAPEMDITKDLLDAVSRTAKLRAKGGSLSESLAQIDAFSQQSETSKALQKLFYDADGKRAASSAQIADALRFYAKEAAKVDAAPGLGLGLPKVTPNEILDIAAIKIGAPKEISAEVLATAEKAAAAGEKVAEAAASHNSGFTLADVDSVRKELVSLYSDAKRSAFRTGVQSDLRAMQKIMDEFDGSLRRLIQEGKFEGDGPKVLAMLEDARAAHADYRQKFTSRGSGDDVGRAVEKILGRYEDTKATPDKIVSMAYGSASVPGGEMPIKIAQRIKTIFGENSSEFATYKQGLFAQLTDGEDSAKVAAKINEFLIGTKGRGLSQVVFSAAERKQLANYANRLSGTVPADNEPGRVAAALRRITGADGGPGAAPNEIVNMLYGSTGKGAGNLSVPLAARLKGELSPEGWTAVRQGMWEKLTNAGEGKIEFGPQALSQRLHEFLNESGQGLAKVLFTSKERELMAQLASVYKQMIPVAGSTNPSGTAPMLARMARGVRHSLLPLLGFSSGGLPGAAVGAAADKGLQAIADANAKRAAQSLFYGAQAKRPVNPRFGQVAGALGQGVQSRQR